MSTALLPYLEPPKGGNIFPSKVSRDVINLIIESVFEHEMVPSVRSVYKLSRTCKQLRELCFIFLQRKACIYFSLEKPLQGIVPFYMKLFIDPQNTYLYKPYTKIDSKDTFMITDKQLKKYANVAGRRTYKELVVLCLERHGTFEAFLAYKEKVMKDRARSKRKREKSYAKLRRETKRLKRKIKDMEKISLDFI